MKPNKIILHSKGQSFEILVDKEDYERISEHNWWVKPAGYIYTQVNRKTIYLHRFVMEAKKGQEIDHINRKKMDNRKENLRFCTRSQNNINKDGIRGVSRFKNKWRARITHNNVEKHLGIFNSFEEALRIRLDVEKKLFGNFANV